jgi:hypothetical protein
MKGSEPMALADTGFLYLLAFDHRGSFDRDVFGASHPISAKAGARNTDARKVAC